MIIINRDTIIKRCNKEILYFLNLNLLNENIYFAGGAFRTFFDKNEKFNDIDLFFKSKSEIEIIQNKLYALNAKNNFTCPDGKLYTFILNDIKIQLITERLYKNVKELLDSFDINACKFCLYDNKFYCYKQSINDVKKKLITINTLEYPVASMNRILKYQLKGYYCPHDTLQFFVNYIWKKGILGETINDRVYID